MTKIFEQDLHHGLLGIFSNMLSVFRESVDLCVHSMYTGGTKMTSKKNGKNEHN